MGYDWFYIGKNFQKNIGHGFYVGYDYKITANELRKSKNVWVIRGYGFYLPWVTRGLTVVAAMVCAEWPALANKRIMFF